MRPVGILMAPWAVLIALLAFSGAAAADCTCRAGGSDYALGETVCLSTPHGFRLAVCGMVLNNTSWKVSPEPCVAAALTDHPQHPLSDPPLAKPAPHGS